MAELSPVDELRKEHQSLLQDCSDLQAVVQALKADDESSRGTAAGMLSDRFGMLQQAQHLHFRREEECLYPDAQRLVSEGAKGADIFGRFFAAEGEDDLVAHTTLRTRVGDILSLLGASKSADRLDNQALGRLRTLVNLTYDLFSRHAHKEDTLIFPMIEGSLNWEQMQAVAERLRAFRGVADLADPRMRQDEGLTDLAIEDH